MLLWIKVALCYDHRQPLCFHIKLPLGSHQEALTFVLATYAHNRSPSSDRAQIPRFVARSQWRFRAGRAHHSVCCRRSGNVAGVSAAALPLVPFAVLCYLYIHRSTYDISTIMHSLNHNGQRDKDRHLLSIIQRSFFTSYYASPLKFKYQFSYRIISSVYIF